MEPYEKQTPIDTKALRHCACGHLEVYHDGRFSDDLGYAIGTSACSVWSAGTHICDCPRFIERSWLLQQAGLCEVWIQPVPGMPKIKVVRPLMPTQVKFDIPM